MLNETIILDDAKDFLPSYKCRLVRRITVEVSNLSITNMNHVMAIWYFK